MSESSATPQNPSSQLQQEIQNSSGVVSGQVSGGIVVGTLIIHCAPSFSTDEVANALNSSFPVRENLGENPYRGLLDFQETHKANFFGRKDEINKLWKKFCELHGDQGKTRLLPIYGPSGSGKSSLARAGLLPELGDCPIPGRERARVVILKPEAHPLESLAQILVKVANPDDSAPVKKMREFTEELRVRNKDDQQYAGLRRIASALPDSINLPLIILVDQFEEVYTLCADSEEKNIFINTLLNAAKDPAQKVSIIITMNSAFLAETQCHKQLNELFSSQGFLVPVMNEDNLRLAIEEPAKKAGRLLSQATVDLLVEQTIGYDGVLPLLQFTLAQVWTEWERGQVPEKTLHDLKGVGGALAKKAQQIYEKLSDIPRGQIIAKRVFVSLVQIGEGTQQNARRRVALDKLRSIKDSSEAVLKVIERFSQPSVRLITRSGEIGANEMVEVTHEALFEHWVLLNQWIKESRNDLPFERRLEGAAQHWNTNKRAAGLLWRSPDLDLLSQFIQRRDNDIHSVQLEFFQASQHQKKLTWISWGILTGSVLCFSIFFFWHQNNAKKTIEAVFLKSNTPDILEALPELEKSANEMKRNVDKLYFSDSVNDRIKYHLQNKKEINKLLAYYRNIITEAGRLRQQDRQYESRLKPIMDTAESSLAELIAKYRIPQLEFDLKLKSGKVSFGKYRGDKSVTDFQDQYSSGALRTTYEVLFTASGAGADLNKDGFIGDQQEAAQMPCRTLKEIEALWRRATGNRCGWYNQEGHYADDRDCKELDRDRSTLYTSIFGHNTDDAIDRIKQCGISPR